MMMNFQTWFKKESSLLNGDIIFLIINKFSQLFLFSYLPNKIYYHKNLKCSVNNFTISKNILFSKNFFEETFPTIQIFFSFEIMNKNLDFIFRILLKKKGIKILFFFLTKSFSEKVLPSTGYFSLGKIWVNIKFLSKIFFFTPFFLKKICSDLTLVKISPRKYVPLMILSNWKILTRACLIKKNASIGKMLKSLIFYKTILAVKRDTFLDPFVFFLHLKAIRDIFQRTSEEAGFITSRLDRIESNQFLLLSNVFIKGL